MPKQTIRNNFSEQLGKETQSINEIWLVYVPKEKNYQKIP